MERGDGFWTSENKGWKTRREEQDRYRRALDQQIEERKKANHSRRSHFRPSREMETPKIQDPVQHLLPWLNNATQTPAPTPAATHPQAPVAVAHQPMVLVQQPQQAEQPQAMHPHPSNPNQAPPNYYYVAHPLPMPQPQAPLQHGQPHHHQQHHQQQQHHQGAFAYFGSSPLPPPAEFAPTVAAPTVTATNPSASYQDKPQEIPERDANSNVNKTPVRPHVAQTSEELPPTQSPVEYRMELAKQVEEKRRQDAEKLRKDQEEEEKLQRKILQDQEKLRREHAEELKRAQEKEEEERAKMSEKVKYFELTKKTLDAEAELEKQRQKSVAERQQQLRDAASNSRAALSTSPSRYYGRDKSRDTPSSWAWESVVVPTRRKHAAETNMNIINHLEEGSGDWEGSHQHEHQKDRQLPSLPQSGKSIPSSARDSARSRRTENDDGDYFDAGASLTSRTYLLSEDRDRDDDQSSFGGSVSIASAGQPGVSKSSEVVGTMNKYDEDMMMCPRCARSFSSTDIQYPESPAERLKILNFLDNIQRKLREDRAKLMRDGFDWSKPTS